MKKLSLIFLASVLWADPFNQKCTFENDTFWIKIIEICGEGDIACDKVAYIGLNKKAASLSRSKARQSWILRGIFLAIYLRIRAIHTA
ncbi:hypothetical protein [Helicobacter sp. T3_23-1059]